MAAILLRGNRLLMSSQAAVLASTPQVYIKLRGWAIAELRRNASMPPETQRLESSAEAADVRDALWTL